MSKGKEEREKLLEERSSLMRRIEEIDRSLRGLAATDPLPPVPSFQGREGLGPFLEGSYGLKAQPLWALSSCLKGHMDREGTLRVLDGRREVCAFFIGSSASQAVLLTQSFLGYLGKSVGRFRELKNFREVHGERPFSGGAEAPVPEVDEMAELKGWLISLMDSLATFHLRSLANLKGTILSSTLASLDQRFALEESTKEFFNPRALRQLLGLMNTETGEFLRPEGPLQEIEGYLEDYLAHSRELGVRKRLLLLLEQMGCPEAEILMTEGKPIGHEADLMDFSLFLPEELLEERMGLEEGSNPGLEGRDSTRG